ncbi:MAG: DUF3034 family protein [Halomonadaceae bacterium]|nr:MAG: DUF3034 family protein [Halomonadaceae bacterium]
MNKNHPLLGSGILILICLFSQGLYADPGSRLWGTGGVTSIEGSAGGGLVPWALLAGYASDEEWGGTVALSRGEFDDYSLTVTSAAVNWRNRFEFSLARQNLSLDTLGPALEQDAAKQDIFGAKVRLHGDVLYSPLGQWSLGIQHKRNRNSAIPGAVGARSDNGSDLYLAGSKLFFGAFFHRNVLVNTTLRSTRANQGGLLGFGGDRNNSHEAQIESSIGIFANRRWLMGAEYRQKPDNLSAVPEDDWWSLYLAWLPDRHLSVTAAWVELGDIVGLEDQRGPYLSIEGSF